MDWFSWLTKARLEPSLVYEYGLAFARNELEEEDTAYFNHEFLQSMGIAIAKHRLEILKLARKERGGRSSFRYPISSLVKKTKKSLGSCIRALVRRQDRALVVVPSSRWRRKREERATMLTNGSGPLAVSAPGLNSFSSPLVLEDDDGGYWTPAVEERRWDTMFQDLKPT